MGEGDDGAVLTAGAELVAELCAFTQLGQMTRPLELSRHLHAEVIEHGVVGVDGASYNYYHWLMNGLARACLCADVAPPQAEILLPDIRAIPDGPGRIRAAVAEASMEAVLAHRPRRFLAPGIHRVQKLHVLWTRPTAPTDIAGLSTLYDLFDQVAARVATPKCAPHRRIYLSRRGAHDQRLPPAMQVELDTLLDRRGFEALDLFNMSFEDQVKAATEAEVILGPHGAALTNLVFSPRQTKVIELTSRIGEETAYRPWYYQLCDGRGQPYGALDVCHPAWLDDLAAAI